MIATPWNLPMAALGILALLWVLGYVVVTLRAREWTASTTLVVAAALVVMGPMMIGDFAHGIVSSTGVFGEPEMLYSPWVSALQRYSLLLFFLACLTYVVACAVRNRAPSTWVGLVLAGAVVLADFGNYATHAKVTDPPLLALAVVLLAAGWASGPAGAARGGVIAVVTVVGLSGLAALTRPDAVWRACRVDKCGPAHALYQGLLVQENTMGLLVALGIPFVMLVTRGKSRVLLVLTLLLVVVATGSRSGQLAAGVATVGSLLLLVRPSAPRWGRLARVAVWVLLLGGFTASLAPLWVSGADSSFTARGELWRIARQRITESAVWGHGSLGWRAIYSAEGLFGDSSTYSAHSQVLDVLFTAGVAGALLVVAGIVLTIRQSTTYRPLVLGLLLTVLWLGALERPWSFSGLDWLSWSLVAFVILGQVVPTAQDELDEGDEAAEGDQDEEGDEGFDDVDTDELEPATSEVGQ